MKEESAGNASDCDEEACKGNAVYIDYDFIERYHKIWKYNITAVPQNDFNNDGLNDYLVCMHGDGFQGDDGNMVRIYIQESDGSLREVYALLENAENMYVHLHDASFPNEHAPVAVLAEKTNGFYAVVLPGIDCILRYNTEKGKYDYYEIGRSISGTEFVDGSISGGRVCSKRETIYRNEGCR